ncbi:M14 family zinc carboxypeptidase [Marinicella sp. W31]|uniref:M14 family zinc carboxypeptidase n=1 Tax=Marinicella sp. W31 TaxID=3023713 RepID=UPI0037578DEA
MIKTILCGLMFITTVVQSEPLEYFLPEEELFDSSVPSPPVIFGQELGQRHLRHDQIVSYLGVLAASSPRAKLIEYGRTHEGRRLVLLAISSADNIARLDELKSNKDVLKVWNGFSIHGNESSGANASVLYAWYVLSTNSETIASLLNNTVILIDPTINPDGLDRFTTYVNNHRSLTTVTDSNDMSHNEIWPNGRTNHYWFDLNRDWLLLTQPESQARIAQFHDWQPHVLTDHHEMGPSATFFFQPGVPERTNPLIPKRNVELTARIAEFHADALDKVGQAYYSKESFDDFYPGKGSTYPDLHGSVGILFEQSSARGGVVMTSEGERHLSSGIRNQFLTARSTLLAAHAERSNLVDYKNSFYEDAAKQSKSAGFAGYVVDISGRQRIGQRLLDFLQMHRIDVRLVTENVKVKGHTYAKNQSLFIPLQQRQYMLIRSLFSTDKQFTDNTFYDISAWNLPMAFGLQWGQSGSTPTTTDAGILKGERNWTQQSVAYVIDWHSGDAPAALNYLMQQGQNLKVSAKPLEIVSRGQNKKLPAGSVILMNSPDSDQDKLFSDLSTVADVFGVSWYGADGGLGVSGIDLGSPQIRTVEMRKVLMLVGQGVNAYQAGSIWHMFDTRRLTPLTKVRQDRFSRVQLSDYTHIILPDGSYSDLSEKIQKKMQEWVRSGGVLIALQRGATWVEKNIQKGDEEADKKPKKDEEKAAEKKALRSYADHDKDFAEKILGGAIIAAKADLSHPLSFGTHLPTQHVLARGRAVLEVSENPYVTPLQALEKPVAAGYISEHWQEKLSEAPLVIAERSGAGAVIKFGFNPNFRAYWEGTQQWMINAIYLSHLIDRTPEE